MNELLLELLAPCDSLEEKGCDTNALRLFLLGEVVVPLFGTKDVHEESGRGHYECAPSGRFGSMPATSILGEYHGCRIGCGLNPEDFSGRTWGDGRSSPGTPARQRLGIGEGNHDDRGFGAGPNYG